ncbi:MAG TPA: asparagine synthase (glutamine-hydrolyzing) [Thermoanaerobaculia bacterium]|nr:asparagine synthase (glutamine-hydrolyzing) [Thermoanaerobaculia bacterium]
MCGIAGVVSSQGRLPLASIVDATLERLCHRGPDDLGYVASRGRSVHLGRRWSQPEFDPEVVLLHRRLSILDTSEAGWQPMKSRDGRFYLVFNGEIYNFIELREELEREGETFHSRSDTEVLIAALRRWGTAATMPRLTGMFAFALLDVETRMLLLARDPFGIKPLYFTPTEDGFVFASEIKALLRLPGVGRQIDANRAYDYIRYAVTDRGTRTLLDSVEQLPGAHYMEVPLDHPRQRRTVRYWDVDQTAKSELSFDAAARELRDRFVHSVRLHLRSDVPVGAALSGGLDSSAIVSTMRHVEGDRLDLHTFSYIAGDDAVNEEPYVDIVAKRNRVTSHKVRLAAGDLRRDVDKLIAAQDEPFGSTTIYAQYRVFQLAKEAGITVMLDGQGADELLGGYHYYISARIGSLLRGGRFLRAARLARNATRLPGENASRTTANSVMRLLAGGAAFVAPRALHGLGRRIVGRDLFPSYLDAAWLRAHDVKPAALHYQPGSRNIFRNSLYETLTATSLPFLLRYEDRNSMAFSIESRVPFLTSDLANFVLSLPDHYLVSDEGTTKNVFRAAMRGIVPDEILDRRDKIGFSTPERTWMTSLRDWTVATLTSDTARAIPLFDHKAMLETWNRIDRGEVAYDRAVWRWCNFIRWVEINGVQF